MTTINTLLTAKWPNISQSLKQAALPLPIFMMIVAIVLGLANGLGNQKIISVIVTGYGNNLGYFCIVLISAFFLAGWLSQEGNLYLGKIGALMSPLLGAGMVCPDTAYASLSPLAGNYRNIIAVGSYSGFKLLLPAGPLIIGVGIGANVDDPRLLSIGVFLMLATFAAGYLWTKVFNINTVDLSPMGNRTNLRLADTFILLLPLIVLFVLLAFGYILKLSNIPVIGFTTAPAGALMTAAILAYIMAENTVRKEMLERAIRRSATLLFLIGCASTLGHMLAYIIPTGFVEQLLGSLKTEYALLLGIFITAGVFKVINGSSLATFSALPPILAPTLAHSGLDLIPVVFTICLGSFIAILPNDSFFWLVKNDAFSNVKTNVYLKIVTGASIFQALVGFAALCLLILLD